MRKADLTAFAEKTGLSALAWSISNGSEQPADPMDPGRATQIREGRGMLRIGSVLAAALLGGGLSLAAQPEQLKKNPTPLGAPSTLPSPASTLPQAGPAVPGPSTDATAPSPAAAAPALPSHPRSEGCEDGPTRRFMGLVPRLMGIMNRPDAPACAATDGPCEAKHKPQVLNFFCYRPRQMTSIHELCMPYNPRPPLYLYFRYPHPLEGPGHPYPYCSGGYCHKGGYCAGCATGPHMVAMPASTYEWPAGSVPKPDSQDPHPEGHGVAPSPGPRPTVPPAGPPIGGMLP